MSKLNTKQLNLKTFLLERATKNESVALCLYWFVKVEMMDTRTLVNSSSVNSGLSASVASKRYFCFFGIYIYEQEK